MAFYLEDLETYPKVGKCPSCNSTVRIFGKKDKVKDFDSEDGISIECDKCDFSLFLSTTMKKDYDTMKEIGVAAFNQLSKVTVK